MDEVQQQSPSNETAEEKYRRIMGDGSEESIKRMALEGMADWEAGRVYTTEQLLERLRAKKANKANNKSTNNQ